MSGSSSAAAFARSRAFNAARASSSGEVACAWAGAGTSTPRNSVMRSREGDDVAGLIGLGRYYSSVPEITGGSVERAREFARRAEKLDPFAGGLELGQLAAQEEKFAEALTHFESAAAAQPGSVNAQFNCGRMLAKLGRKDEARARFEAALKINPAFEAATKAIGELGAAAP